MLEGKPGDMSQFIAIDENKIIRKPLLEAVASTQAVAEAIKAKDFKKAMELRGPEFAEYYNAYVYLPFASLTVLLLGPLGVCGDDSSFRQRSLIQVFC